MTPNRHCPGSSCVSGGSTDGGRRVRTRRESGLTRFDRVPWCRSGPDGSGTAGAPEGLGGRPVVTPDGTLWFGGRRRSHRVCFRRHTGRGTVSPTEEQEEEENEVP